MVRATAERLVFLDTETTGLDPKLGHRIIEVGAIEAIDRRLTDHRFHRYVNPDREIDPGAIAVHGITNDFLADKPRFAEIASDLVAYLDGATIVIHNAAFDLGFLDHEFGLLRLDVQFLKAKGDIVDSLALARTKFPGKRNSLDALCERFGIDNSSRNLHGALLDARLLGEVYFALTREQTSISIENESDAQENWGEIDSVALPASAADMVAIDVPDALLAAHRTFVFGDKTDLPENQSRAWT
jgi:DNA polymerase III subunit epsilon